MDELVVKDGGLLMISPFAAIGWMCVAFLAGAWFGSWMTYRWASFIIEQWKAMYYNLKAQAEGEQNETDDSNSRNPYAFGCDVPKAKSNQASPTPTPMTFHAMDRLPKPKRAPKPTPPPEEAPGKCTPAELAGKEEVRQ